MGTGRGKEKQQESQLLTNAQSAQAAYQESPLEAQQRARVQGFLSDLDAGKDVRDINYVKPYLNLYNNAINRQTDEKGVGTLGFNALSGEGGGKMAGLIGAQLKARRDQDASGQLYNSVNAAQADATNNQLPFLIGTEQSRMANKAHMATGLYSTYLNRPQRQSIWEKMLLAGIQGGSQIAAAAV